MLFKCIVYRLHIQASLYSLYRLNWLYSITLFDRLQQLFYDFMTFCANYTKTVVFCCAFCHIMSQGVKTWILYNRLITRFKGYLRHFMVLWYIYTLSTLKGLKRANKHVTRHIKHFTLYSVTHSQGFYTRWQDTHTHWQVNRWTGYTKRGHNTPKSVSCPLLA